ncbi:hypothetical protein PHMEG_0009933 [Phytophthora megakarya]|uniref:Uncharacterized protein n=1 Tax=Phytophthora megakarya TaxID=4795 RepID=A0A225WFJ2_9STRA|nr:hypothetical protein PHMEG_0009933 [Phytophthora megakarya]
MPPHKIWGIKGRKGSAKVQGLNKHTGRMTAVLTIRADGFVKKNPILFILRGILGGTIDSHELDMLPSGQFYTVQEAGWMDATGRAFYVEKTYLNLK